MRKTISAILIFAFAVTGIGDCPQRGVRSLPAKGLSPQVKLAPESQVKSKELRNEFANEVSRDPSRIRLKDGARVAVVGGGPAGSFFAISLLRKAKELGIKVEVVIIEEKKDLQFYGLPCQSICKEGCNYCAGIISPRMSDVLKRLKMEVPKTLIQGRVNTITVQGDWKNMELRVPKKRRMFSVYRGSRPKARIDKFVNFDSFLLEKAKEEGAKVIAGKVSDVKRSNEGKPRLRYKITEGVKISDETLEADFVVFAGGVNHPIAGARFATNGLQRSLQDLMPGFAPPKARKALIFELESDEESVRRMAGKAYFIEYGSKDLKIEMCSIMPKGEKFITVVVIGKSVDDNELRVKERFLELPHIKKILPKNARLKAVCACNPNMTVTAATNPFSDRVAVVGDAAVCRLYKDGIYSAYITAQALADTMLEVGIDKGSLKKGYGPVIKKFSGDNLFGRFVFMLNRLVFSSPSLSRILYQAISTERKINDKDDRRLEAILWRIASGDDDYKEIFMSMFHPATMWSVLAGGALITLRNYITERIFGIDWRGIGRYPTGVYKEELEGKRRMFIRDLHKHQIEARPGFENMYSIRVMSDKRNILEQLGKFGEKDMEYFSPRMIHVRRVQGGPNQLGSVIRYKFLFGLVSLDIILEGVVQGRYLVYKVKDGFAKGGVLIFNIDKVNEGECILSIYVAFDVPKGKGIASKLFWKVFSKVFPTFLHDVIWNHALCKLKDIVEAKAEHAEPDIAVELLSPGVIGNRENMTRESLLAPASRFSAEEVEEKAREMFARALNHHLNQKFTVIYSAIDFIKTALESGKGFEDEDVRACLEDMESCVSGIGNIITRIEGIMNPVDAVYYTDTRMLDLENSNKTPNGGTVEERRIKEAKLKVIDELRAPLAAQAKRALGEIEENLRLFKEKVVSDKEAALKALDRIREATETIEDEVKAINGKAGLDHTGNTRRLTKGDQLIQESSRCP